MADYKLEIDLPGDLIANVMVQGERSVPLVSFFVEHDTTSSTPQAELQKKELGQVKTVLVKHTGVDEETLGKLVYLSLSFPPSLFKRQNFVVLFIGLWNGFVIGVSGTADVNPNNETSNPKHPPPIIHAYQRRRN